MRLVFSLWVTFWLCAVRILEHRICPPTPTVAKAAFCVFKFIQQKRQSGALAG